MLLGCLLLLATVAPAQDEPDKSVKPPNLTLLEFEAWREDGRILFDGLVRVNVVDKPMAGLQVWFKLLDASGKTIAQKNADVTQQLLEPEDEEAFYFQCADHARAVAILVEVRTKKRMYYTLENAGPHEIL